MAIEYVNGKELFQEMQIYHEKYKASKEAGEERPPITTKIGAAIIQICTRLMNSYNFVGYTYRDEMIADAILQCMSKIHLFDPEKSSNVFAYVSQIAWNEAVLRIKLEQKESSIKAKLIREKMSSEFVQHGVDADSDDGSNSFVEFLKENDAYIDYIELKKEKIEEERHASMKHRNKTPYQKKVKEPTPIEELFNLDNFESDE